MRLSQSIPFTPVPPRGQSGPHQPPPGPKGRRDSRGRRRQLENEEVPRQKSFFYSPTPAAKLRVNKEWAGPPVDASLAANEPRGGHKREGSSICQSRLASQHDSRTVHYFSLIFIYLPKWRLLLSGVSVPRMVLVSDFRRVALLNRNNSPQLFRRSSFVQQSL